MDSRENPQQPPHRPLPGMMMGPTSYPTTAAPHHLMNNPNSSATMMQPRFNFNSVVSPPPSSEPLESMADATCLYDGSSPSGFSIEPAKKKRGRPRKYAPEGNIALGLGPASTPPSSVAHVVGTSSPPSEQHRKKHGGRPPGSGKKELDALGSGGVGFTPHVILVKTGEDIASKIAAFSQQGPRTVCILSANGAVRNVSLKQPALSGAAVSYEGWYEIISLSGSFVYVENVSGSDQNRTSGLLSVSLAGSDGRVLGGGVTGMLIAASPVQVIVGSFIMEGKKSSSNIVKSEPSAPQPQNLSYGTQQMLLANPKPSQEEGSSESSDDCGGGSPIRNRASGVYYNNNNNNNNNNNVSQAMPNMQQQQQNMHHHPHPHLWAATQAHHRNAQSGGSSLNPSPPSCNFRSLSDN